MDPAEASRSDKLTHTVSCDRVVKPASEAFCARRLRLVEAVANAVLAHRPGAVAVTVHKPHAPIAATFDEVGATIERVRTGS